MAASSYLGMGSSFMSDRDNLTNSPYNYAIFLYIYIKNKKKNLHKSILIGYHKCQKSLKLILRNRNTFGRL